MITSALNPHLGQPLEFLCLSRTQLHACRETGIAGQCQWTCRWRMEDHHRTKKETHIRRSPLAHSPLVHPPSCRASQQACDTALPALTLPPLPPPSSQTLFPLPCYWCFFPDSIQEQQPPLEDLGCAQTWRPLSSRSRSSVPRVRLPRCGSVCSSSPPRHSRGRSPLKSDERPQQPLSALSVLPSGEAAGAAVTAPCLRPTHAPTMPLPASAVEQLVLWRDVKTSGLVFGGITVAYLAARLNPYPLLTILFYMLSLAATTMTIWAQLGAVVSKWVHFLRRAALRGAKRHSQPRPRASSRLAACCCTALRCACRAATRSGLSF